MRRTTSSASFSCDYDQTLLIVPSVSKIWGIPFSKKSFSGGWVFYKQWSFALVNINPKHFIELWKDLSLRLIVRRFQRSCKVQFPLSRPRPDVFIRGWIPPPPLLQNTFTLGARVLWKSCLLLHLGVTCILMYWL